MPGNCIWAKVGHAIGLGTLIWALAHLLANETVVHVMLFEEFSLWAAVDLGSLCRCDRIAEIRYSVPGDSRDVLALGAGAIAWLVFAFFGHPRLLGVSPLEA